MTDQADTPTARCPICGKPADDAFRPFCSKRCADVDLNRWLSGVYAVPGKEEEDEDGRAATRAGEDGAGTQLAGPREVGTGPRKDPRRNEAASVPARRRSGQCRKQPL